MQLVDMLFDEIEDAKKRRVPFIIPIGTIEYHAHHASCGCDTMVINGAMRELEKSKEIVVCPPIWYGVASYAVGGPETGTIQVDVDVFRHPAEFHQAKNVDNKEQNIKTNGVYENTPC